MAIFPLIHHTSAELASSDISRVHIQTQSCVCPLSHLLSRSVRVLSDTSAVVTYVRLRQTVKTNAAGNYEPKTVVSQETRVWQRFGSDNDECKWKNVHLHRSMMS